MSREIKKVISILGSQKRLAKAIGVSNNAVCKWVAQGYLPPGRAMAVYKLVENKRTPNGELVSLESLLIESTNVKNSQYPINH